MYKMESFLYIYSVKYIEIACFYTFNLLNAKKWVGFIHCRLTMYKKEGIFVHCQP